MNLSLLKLVFPVAVLAWLFLTIICLYGDFLAVAISACVVVTASNVLNFQYWLEQMFELYYSSCIYLLWFCETSVKMFSVNWCTSWKCLNICQSWEKIVVFSYLTTNKWLMIANHFGISFCQCSIGFYFLKYILCDISSSN